MRNTAFQIYELLSTMSATEKSYVKKTFSSNEKNMSLLFNDLNKCDQFDKKTFLNQYQKRPYMKYLSQNCSYLLKSMTKSLIDYNIENLTEINIMSRLSLISLLVKKGMYSTCIKKIDKEIELAITYQYYEYGYKLIRLKERFYKIYLLQKFSYNEHIELDSKKKFFIQQLQLIDELELLCTALSNEKLSTPEKLNLVATKFETFNFCSLEKLPSQTPLMVKLNFNYINYKTSQLRGKPETKHLSQSLLDFENQSFLKNVYFESYILVIANYLESLIVDLEFEVFFESYEKYTKELRSFAKWNSMQTSPFYYIIEYFTFIKACLYSKCSNKAVQKANEYQQVISKNHNTTNSNFITHAISLNATVFFNNGYINEALNTIELLQKDKSIATQYFYKVMQILCHYKLNNMMLIYSLSNSLTTYLRKNKQAAMLNEFLKIKKCLFDEDCNNLKLLEFLPHIDLYVVKETPNKNVNT